MLQYIRFKFCYGVRYQTEEKCLFLRRLPEGWERANDEDLEHEANNKS